MTLTVEVVLYTDFTVSKRVLTLESPCRTSQNKCHVQLLFIKFMYINFHLDILTTVE